MVSSSSRDLDVESRLGRREVVADLAREALATGDLDRVLETVVAEVAETLECGYCGAFERLPDGDVVVRRAAGGRRADAGEETAAAGDGTLAGVVLGRDEPLVVQNRTAEGRVPGDGSLAADEFSAVVGVRVGPAADPWGLLVAAGPEPGAFTDADGEFLERVAEVTAGSLPTVEGDRDQLRQVFQNLLDNAVEYSGDEPPRVHVDAERSGDEWLLSVADEGVGIPSESSETVFEVFQRLHSREDHEGTGIGLALCDRIVERHGGDVWVESEPGEGSTFYFTLPGGGRDE